MILDTLLSQCCSKVEDDYVDLAKSLMEKAEAKGVKFLLPEDIVVADKVLGCGLWY